MQLRTSGNTRLFFQCVVRFLQVNSSIQVLNLNPSSYFLKVHKAMNRYLDTCKRTKVMNVFSNHGPLKFFVPPLKFSFHGSGRSIHSAI